MLAKIGADTAENEPNLLKVDDIFTNFDKLTSGTHAIALLPIPVSRSVNSASGAYLKREALGNS